MGVSVFERVFRLVLSGVLGLSGYDGLKPIFVGLSLIRQPSTFKVVLGVLEKRPLPEISQVYGVNYNYVQRVVNKLAKEGLVVKTRVLGKVVVLPTPTLESAFKLAARELYLRARRNEVDLSKYGLTVDLLAKVLKREERMVVDHERRA